MTFWWFLTFWDVLRAVLQKKKKKKKLAILVLKLICFGFKQLRLAKKEVKSLDIVGTFPFYFSFSIISLRPGFEPLTSLCTTLILRNSKKRKKHRQHTHTHTGNQFCQSAQSARLSWLRTLCCLVRQISRNNRYKHKPARNTFQLLPPGFTAKASLCKRLLWIHCMHQTFCFLKVFTSRTGNSFFRGGIYPQSPCENLWAHLNSWSEFLNWLKELVYQSLKWAQLTGSSRLIASCCESFILWVNWVPNFALSNSQSSAVAHLIINNSSLWKWNWSYEVIIKSLYPGNTTVL